MGRVSFDDYIAKRENVEKLFDAMTNPEADLSEFPAGVFEKMQDIFWLDRQMERFRLKPFVINMYLARKKSQDPDGNGIHLASAYRDFCVDGALFGLPDNDNKNYKRKFLISWGESLLKKMEDDKAWKAVPAMFKQVRELAELDKEVDIDEELLRNPIPMVVSFNPKLVTNKEVPQEKIDDFIKRFKAQHANVDDVDFEEIEENE